MMGPRLALLTLPMLVTPGGSMHHDSGVFVLPLPPPPRVLIVVPEPPPPPRSFEDVLWDVLSGR